MNDIERKYELRVTPRFKKAVLSLVLDEYEQQVVDASIARFCASLDKSSYNPIVQSDGQLFYEFVIPTFTRQFRVLFFVHEIEATGITFEELC